MLYQIQEFIVCDRASGLNIAVIGVELVPSWNVILNQKKAKKLSSKVISMVYLEIINTSYEV